MQVLTGYFLCNINTYGGGVTMLDPLLVWWSATEWRFRDWDGDGGSSSTARDGTRGGVGESDLVPLAIVDAGEIRQRRTLDHGLTAVKCRVLWLISWRSRLAACELPGV